MSYAADRERLQHGPVTDAALRFTASRAASGVASGAASAVPSRERQAVAA
jgi:hypothetical protein